MYTFRKTSGMLLMLLGWMMLMTSTANAQRTIPAHNAIWVHDEAGVLSEQTRLRLEQALQADRDKTSNQIAVLIIPSLDGEDVDDYAYRVFREWQLGQKGKDNGVLWLISIADRKMRIEVGKGLEGVLTDLASSRINRNQVAPAFKKGDYDGGVEAGITAIQQVIRGEYVNDNPKPKRKKRKSSPLLTMLIVLVVIILIARRRGGGGGGGYWSSGGGWIGPVGGFGSSSGSWGSDSGGGDFGGGGFSGGGGSSDSW